MPPKPETGWVIRVRLANGMRLYLMNEAAGTPTGLGERMPWSPRDHDARLFDTEDEAQARAAPMQTSHSALEYEVCKLSRPAKRQR